MTLISGDLRERVKDFTELLLPWGLLTFYALLWGRGRLLLQSRSFQTIYRQIINLIYKLLNLPILLFQKLYIIPSVNIICLSNSLNLHKIYHLPRVWQISDGILQTFVLLSHYSDLSLEFLELLEVLRNILFFL